MSKLDSEEKELLKKLVSKVENLENKIDERDQIIQKLQDNRGRQPKKEHPEWGPLPKDRLARLLVQKAREKVAHTEVTQERAQRTNTTIKDLKNNFSFGELARFALKHRMLPTGKESSKVSAKGQIKVYED